MKTLILFNFYIYAAIAAVSASFCVHGALTGAVEHLTAFLTGVVVWCALAAILCVAIGIRQP